MMLNIKMLWLGEYRFGVVIVIAVEQLEGFSVGIKQDNLCHIKSVVTACHWHSSRDQCYKQNCTLDHHNDTNNRLLLQIRLNQARCLIRQVQPSILLQPGQISLDEVVVATFRFQTTYYQRKKYSYSCSFSLYFLQKVRISPLLK